MKEQENSQTQQRSSESQDYWGKQLGLSQIHFPYPWREGTSGRWLCTKRSSSCTSFLVETARSCLPFPGEANQSEDVSYSRRKQGWDVLPQPLRIPILRISSVTWLALHARASGASRPPCDIETWRTSLFWVWRIPGRKLCLQNRLTTTAWTWKVGMLQVQSHTILGYL